MKETLDLNPSQLKTGKEKASYCLGLDAGNSIKMQFNDIDLNLLLQGFQDALHQNAPKVTQKEFQATMSALQEQVQQQQKAYIAQLAQSNKRTAEEFLTKNKAQPNVTTLTSGLQYEVLESGSGASPTLTDIVSVHYKGTFIDGTVFDSSYERNKPQVFPVNRVIAGWSEVLQLMKVGDKWKVFIPPYLAYGEAGFPPHIEPNTLLIFEMELLSINENK